MENFMPYELYFNNIQKSQASIDLKVYLNTKQKLEPLSVI